MRYLSPERAGKHIYSRPAVFLPAAHGLMACADAHRGHDQTDAADTGKRKRQDTPLAPVGRRSRGARFVTRRNMTLS